VLKQVDGAGWGLANAKLKGESDAITGALVGSSSPGDQSYSADANAASGLSHPALGVLIVAKHLSYAGRDEFNFAQVEEEYLRFSRTKLVGSGRTRWAIGVLKTVSQVSSNQDTSRSFICNTQILTVYRHSTTSRASVYSLGQAPQRSSRNSQECGARSRRTRSSGGSRAKGRICLVRSWAIGGG
jgi:hypothetical protein